MEAFKWFECPKCGKHLLKITDKSIVKNEIYCRCCKIALDVEIEGLEVKKAESVKKVS